MSAENCPIIQNLPTIYKREGVVVPPSGDGPKIGITYFGTGTRDGVSPNATCLAYELFVAAARRRSDKPDALDTLSPLMPSPFPSSLADQNARPVPRTGICGRIECDKIVGVQEV